MAGQAVASPGVVQKAAGADEWRIVYDATHKVNVNHRIKVRDQVRNPLWQDVESVMEHLGLQEEVVRFSLLYIRCQQGASPDPGGREGLQVHGLPGPWG